MRTPISRRRCATMNASTPYRPIAASERRDDAERRQQRDAEAPPRQRVRQLLVHRQHRADRLILVDLPDRVAHGVGQRCRRAPAFAATNTIDGHGVLTVGHVQRRLRRARRATRHATSPTTPTTVIWAGLVDREVLADRIAAGPVPLRHRGADDGDERPSFAVAVLERAAAQQRDPHRPEVVGRRGPIVGASPGRSAAGRGSSGRACCCPAAAAAGWSRRRRSTPGTCRSASSARSQNSAFCAGVG